MTKTEEKIPTKIVTKNPIKTKRELTPQQAAKRAEVKAKILKYLGQALTDEDQVDVPKQELAEGCGYAVPNSHGFSYAWQELVQENLVTRSSKKGCGRLTEEGKKSIPKGVVVEIPKDNEGKRMHLIKQLQRKLAKKAPPEKIVTVIDVLKDGKPHHLDELCKATGWKGLSTHAFGYIMSALKKQNLAEYNSKEKLYTLTDIWYPNGRP